MDKADHVSFPEACGGESGSAPDRPPCDPASMCCFGSGGGGAGGSGGGGGGSGGAGSSGGGGEAPRDISLVDVAAHSPAPNFNVTYDHRYKNDRGLGMGWSHSYMYLLLEDNATGNVIAYTQTGNFPWIYTSNGDDATYTAAPYDRTVLIKTGSGMFEATGKDDTTYSYNASGRLTSLADLNGNQLTLTYNASGRLIEVEDDFQRSVQLAWYNSDPENPDGYLQSVTDPDNNTYAFSYTADGSGGYNLTTITYPDSSTRTFEYNDPYDPNNLTRIIDNNGNTSAAYTYDSQGRLVEQRGAQGSSIKYTDYSPAREAFFDDFQDGSLDTEKWDDNGTVTITDDPDIERLPGDKVVRFNQGSIEYKSEALQNLKVSVDMFIDDNNEDNATVNIYDSTRGKTYGPWVNFQYNASTEYYEVKARFIYDNGTAAQEKPVTITSNLERGEWHHIEIEVDARTYYNYFKIWIDCEDRGGYPFAREIEPPDSVSPDSVLIDAAYGNGYVYVDNFQFEEVTMDETSILTTDSHGNSRQVTMKDDDNAYGGVTWEVVKRGKMDEGCDSCSLGGKEFAFDDKWNLRRIIDGNGNITEMTYDSRGNMLSKTQAKGTTLEHTTTWTYHADFHKVLTETVPSIDPAGDNKTITYTYDLNGNLLTQTVTGYSNGEEFSYLTTYTYNDKGQLLTQNGPRTGVADNATYSRHATYGYLTEVQYPNGTISYSAYDNNHNAGTVTDKNNVDTDYTYDYAGRVKTITIGTAVTSYTYDLVGNLTQVEMPEGNSIDYTYDGSYNVTRITDDRGNYILYDYDDNGNKIREEYHDDNGTLTKYLDFSYDQADRLQKIMNPDNSFTAFEYDNNTNRTEMVDPRGVVADYEYDELDRLVRVIQASGTEDNATTEYEYDGHDNLILVRDAEGKETTYTYDDFGRLIKTVSPDSGTTAYEYDEAGNLTKKKDARNLTVRYTYDALNRLTLINYPNDTDTSFTYDETHTLYGIDRLTGMTDASGTTKYYYDLRGNITKQANVIDDVAYTTEYSYDLNNRVTGMTYPSGREITYNRDTVGNIISIDNDTTQIVSGMEYAPFGGLQEMQFDLSGLQTSISRDNQYRIKTIQAGSVIDRTYTHDFAGNITSIKRFGNDAQRLPQSYAGSESYSYVTGSDKIDEIDGSQTDNQYTYDAAGNVTGDGFRGFTWNNAGRLSQATMGWETDYVYNGKGQRVKKITGDTVTVYHYDLQGNLIAETDDGDNPLQEYVYAGTERLVMIDDSENVYYYHNDHLGTPQAITNDNGTIVWRACYTPFGDAVVEVGSSVTNNFRFPGQYYDEETGLHYNYHRYYDPDTGRYITPDPIGIEWGNNHLYVYAKNNPIRFIDPLGLAVLDSWPFNGNVFPGYDDQDDRCSSPAGFLNNNECTKKCCVEHDRCYEKYHCNYTSWFLVGLPGPCKKCNFKAAFCVMTNMAKDNCNEECGE